MLYSTKSPLVKPYGAEDFRCGIACAPRQAAWARPNGKKSCAWRHFSRPETAGKRGRAMAGKLTYNRARAGAYRKLAMRREAASHPIPDHNSSLDDE